MALFVVLIMWTLAYFLAIFTVLSVDDPSAIIISSTHPLRALRHIAIFFSSLKVAMATDNVVFIILYIF